MEYLYHIVIPKNHSAKINDCFNKICKTNSKPFIHNLAETSVYKTTHMGACFLNKKELSIFEIVLDLDNPDVFWWKVSEENGCLEDCNDADCFVYLGEKTEYKQLFKKAGFIYLSKDDG